MPWNKSNALIYFRNTEIFVLLVGGGGEASENARITRLLLPKHPKFRPLFLPVGVNASPSKGGLFRSSCWPPKGGLDGAPS